MGTTTVVFTDVERSSALLDAGGDDAVVALTDHLRACREIVERSDGRVPKTMGDGIMALFDSAYDAIGAAIGLQQSTERQARAGSGIRIRIGVHIGEVVTAAGEDDDAFGMTVVVAQRLCAAAEAEQVLVSDLVRQLVGTRGSFRFGDRRSVELDGVAGAVDAWEVGWDRLPAVSPPTVVVADDVAIVRTGVVRLLAAEGFDVVAEADDHDSLVASVRRHRPDLVVTDIRMPPNQRDEGLRAVEVLRAEQPGLATLVLSQHVEPSAAALLLQDEPASIGYLLKERVADLDEFVDVCRRVTAGECVIDPSVTSRLVASSESTGGVDRLTAAERQVLDLMAQGRSNDAIARQVACAPKTVESHVRSIFTKLDLEPHPDDNRRVAAVVTWLHAAGAGGADEAAPI